MRDEFNPTESARQLLFVDGHDAVLVVPDVDALLKGDYERQGPDLLIKGPDGSEFIIIGYFSAQTVPALLSPEGAVVLPETASALAGPRAPGQYAQAGDGGNAVRIGAVQSAEGSVTVQRADGTVVTLQNGDPVFQNDVIITGGDSAVGIVFLDETVFTMTSDARFVLNEMIYDPGEDDNSLVVDVLQGAFVFVTGEIAGTGGMTVETPVATLGIRGTTVTGRFDLSSSTLTVGIENDPGSSIVGSYQIFRKGTNEVLATVDSTETVFTITSVTGQVFEFAKPDDFLTGDDVLTFFDQVYDNFIADPVVDTAPQDGTEAEGEEAQEEAAEGGEEEAEAEAEAEAGEGEAEGESEAGEGEAGEEGAPEGQGEEGAAEESSAEAEGQGQQSEDQSEESSAGESEAGEAQQGEGQSNEGQSNEGQNGEGQTGNGQAESNETGDAGQSSQGQSTSSPGGSGTTVQQTLDNTNSGGTTGSSGGTGQGGESQGQVQQLINDASSEDSEPTPTVVVTETTTTDPVDEPTTRIFSETTTEQAPVTNPIDLPNAVSFVILDQPVKGTASIESDGSYRFDPGNEFDSLAEGEVEQVTFSYGEPGNAPSGEVTVEVVGQNTAPVITLPDTSDLSTNEDAPTTITGFSAVDPEGGALTINVAALSTVTLRGFSEIDGVVTKSAELIALEDQFGPLQFAVGDGFDDEEITVSGPVQVIDFAFSEFIYTPTPDSNTGGLTFTVDDGTQVSAATVSVAITPENDAPVAPDDFNRVATEQGQQVQANFTAFDPDPGDQLTYTILSQPTRGTVSLDGDGSFLFDPGTAFDDVPAGDSLTVFFTYQATDSTGLTSDPATVSVTVNGVNDAPTANADSVSTDEDNAITFDVLGNDSDPDGDALSVTGATITSGGGVVAINADNTLTYTPPANASGAVTISYDISDGNGGLANALATVTVNPINDAPTSAGGTSVTVIEDGSVTLSASDFPFSDIDAGDVLTSIKITGLPNSGGLFLSGVAVTLDQVIGVSDINAGTLTYEPAANVNGNNVDAFTYQVGDGADFSSDTLLSVNVTAVNDPILAAPDLPLVAPGVTTALDVKANDTDVDGDATVAVPATSLRGVGLSVNPDGTVAYAHNGSFIGYDEFTYTLTDPADGSTSSALVVVRVEPVDTANSAQSGTSGGDYLFGTLGDNTLTGGDGFDSLIGSRGLDTFDPGGSYTDFNNGGEVNYADEVGPNGVQVTWQTITSGTAFDTYGDQDILNNVFEIVGTANGDLFDYSAATVVPTNDEGLFITPLSGADIVRGNTGFDIVNYNTSLAFQSVFLGQASGIVANFATGQFVDPWGDIDLVFDIEAVIGTQFADTFIGDANFNRFRGLDGVDIYQATTTGIEEVDFRRDANSGGSGDIIVDLSTGFARDGFGNVEDVTNVDRVRGGETTNDQLTGSAGDNRIRGEGGDDILRGLQGSDRLEGGDGDDTLEGGDEASITGGPSDKLRGNDGNDILTAGFGRAANMVGGQGNDLLQAAGTFDDGYDAFVLYNEEGGSFGIDVEFTAPATAKVNDTFNDGSLRPSDAANTENVDTLVNLSEISGTLLADTVVLDDSIGGDANGDGVSFRPFAGMDFIDANPTIFNVLKYNSDVNFGGNGGITVFFDRSQNNQFVDTWGNTDPWGDPLDGAFGVILDPFGDVDLFSGIMRIRGTEFTDFVLGDENSNQFQPFLGADFYDGAGGIDTIDLRESGGLSRDTGVVIDLTNDTFTDGFGNTGIAANVEWARGSSLGDIIIGDAGTSGNRLRGEDGDDQLDGAGGIGDRLEGDAGSDIFVISSNYASTDQFAVVVIEDFNLGEDRIGLADGLGVQEIEFRQEGSDTFLYTMSFDGEVQQELFLARLVGVDAAALQAAQNDNDPNYDPFVQYDRPGNDAPLANDDTETVPEDGSGMIDVLSNDFDIDGDQLAISSFSNGTNGTVAQDIETGQLTYTPDPNFFGTDTFTYTISDGSETGTATATVTITVTSFEDEPTLSNVPSSVTVVEDGEEIVSGITVADGDGDNLIVTLSVNQGTVELTDTTGLTLFGGDGPASSFAFEGSIAAINAALSNSIRYTPDGNYNGADTLTVELNDAPGEGDQTQSATIDIDVTPVNDQPIVNNPFPDQNVDEGQVLLADMPGDVFSDVDGDPITITAFFLGEGPGPLPDWLSFDGSTFTAAPDASDIGQYLINVTGDDGSGAANSSVDFTFTFTVDDVEHDPAAPTTNSVTTDEDTASAAITIGATDADNDALTYSVKTGSEPSKGSVTFSGDTFTYTPDANETGADAFTIQIDDGNGGTPAEQAVTVTINAENDPSIVAFANGSTISQDEDSSFLIDFISIGDNDSCPVTVIIGTPGGGTFDFSEADVRDLEFDPASLSGQSQYQIDGTVSDINDAFSVATFNMPANIVSDVLINVRVIDGDGGDITETLTINVNPVNDAPTTSDVTTSIEEDSGALSLDGTFPFTDTELGPIGGVIIDTLPTLGVLSTSFGDITTTDQTVADVDLSSLTYTPNDNATGGDSFDFRVVDDQGEPSAAASTYTVNITPLNDQPTFNYDSAEPSPFAGTEDTDFSIAPMEVADLDGDTLTLTVSTASGTISYGDTTGLTFGSGSVNSAATVTVIGSAAAINAALDTAVYSPTANTTGLVSVSFDVTDGTTPASEGIVIELAAVNDAPTVPANNSTTTNEDTATGAVVIGANDIDSANLIYRLKLNDGPQLGTVTFSGDTFTYTPNANISGTDTFTIEVLDSIDGTPVEQAVTVTINPVNDAPTTADTGTTIAEDSGPLALDGTFPFTDPEAGPLNGVIIDTLPTLGVLSTSLGNISSAGTSISAAALSSLVYTPNANANGGDSFDFRVIDDQNEPSAAASTYSITITSTNDAPTSAGGTTLTVLEDGSVTLTSADFPFSDVDAGDALAEVKITALPTNGTLEVSNVAVTLNQVISIADINAGNLTYAPNANISGADADTFTYQVGDGTAFSSDTQLGVDVTPVNDSPVIDNTTILVSGEGDNSPIPPNNVQFELVDAAGDGSGLAEFSDPDAGDTPEIDISTIAINGTNFSGIGSVVSGFQLINGVNGPALLIDVDGQAGLSQGETAEFTVTFQVTSDGAALDGDPQVTGTIRFTGDDDAPEIFALTEGETLSGTEDNSVLFDFREVIGISRINALRDADSDTMTLTITVTNPADGTLTFSPGSGTNISLGAGSSLTGGTTLTITGPTSEIEQALLGTEFSQDTISFVPAANVTGAIGLSFTLMDDTGLTDTETVTITLAAENDAPTIEVSAALDGVIGANLLTNGSFETPANSADQLSLTSLTGWTVETGNVDILNPFWRSGIGSQSLDLHGDTKGSISQTFTTEVGEYYEVSFLMAGDPANGNAIKDVTVSAAGVSESFSYDSTGQNIATLNWESKTFDFVATGTSTTLTFVSDDEENASGPGIDGVEVLKKGVSTDEDTAVAISGITVADIDGDSLTVTVTADNGTVDFTSGTDTSNLSGISGQGTGSLVFTGSATAITAALAASLEYTPGSSFVGTDNFTVSVDDGTAPAVSDVIAVEVLAGNAAPTPQADVDSTDQNTVLNGDFFADNGSGVDSDPDGDSFTITSFTDASGVLNYNIGSAQPLGGGGSITLNADGTFSFDAEGAFDFLGAGQQAAYNFLYQVTDTNGATSTPPTTATVRINGLNDGPTTNTFTVTGVQNEEYTFSASDFPFNDPDTNDELDTVRIVSHGSGGGSLTLSDNPVSNGQVIDASLIDEGFLKYVPVVDQTGAGVASFDFDVSDGTASSASNVFTIDLDAPPPTQSFSRTANRGETTSFNNLSDSVTQQGALVDDDGDSVSVDASSIGNITTANGGTVVMSANGNFTYNIAASTVPTDARFFDTFEYTLTEGDLTTTNTYTIEVNARPQSVASSVTTDEDTPFVFQLSDFNFTDSDTADTFTSLLIWSEETAGDLELGGVDVAAFAQISATQIANGDLTFTPDPDANGAGYATFGFGTGDGSTFATTTTMTINVDAVNDAPVAIGELIATNEDTVLNGDLFADNGGGVDSDVDGDTFTVSELTSTDGTTNYSIGSEVTLPSGAKLTVNSDGTFTFDPRGAFDFVPASGSSADNVRYRITDSNGEESEGVLGALVNLSVTGVNDAPTSVASTVTATEDTDFTFASGDFGFTDPDSGGSLGSVRIDSLPDVTDGVLYLGNDSTPIQVNDVLETNQLSSLFFRPAQDVEGVAAASFNFTVADDEDQFASNQATMTIDITGTSDPLVVTGTTNPADFGDGDGAGAPGSPSGGIVLIDQVTASDPDAGETPTIDQTDGTTTTVVVSIDEVSSTLLSGTAASRGFFASSWANNGAAGNGATIFSDLDNYSGLTSGETLVFTVTFDVISGVDRVSGVSFQFNVVGEDDTPFVTTPLFDQTVQAGATLANVNVNGVFFDPENAALTFSIEDSSNSPVSWVSQPSSGFFTFAPTGINAADGVANANGRGFDLTLIGDDGTNQPTDGFTVTVTPDFDNTDAVGNVITGDGNSNYLADLLGTALTFNGGLGDDFIDARAGDDTVNGGGGNDILRGGAGSDTLRGDDVGNLGGIDTFVLTDTPGGVDIDSILDFETGTNADKLDISALLNSTAQNNIDADNTLISSFVRFDLGQFQLDENGTGDSPNYEPIANVTLSGFSADIEVIFDDAGNSAFISNGLA